MSFLFRRATSLKSFPNPRILIWARSKFSSGASTPVPDKEDDQRRDSFVNYGKRLHLSPLFLDRNRMEDCKIELVDNETWQMSSGLADVWKGNDLVGLAAKPIFSAEEEEDVNGQMGYDYEPPNNPDPDFDEIEDMRVRGNLFYKLDKDSKEYEECKFDFHRRKYSKSQNDPKEKQTSSASRNEKGIKNKEEHKEIKKEKKPNHNNSGLPIGKVNSFKGVINKDELLISGLQFGGGDCLDGKKLRVPTFNQLTAPYHQPFCLDIYVTKGSVRACVIHRGTSKVVAVAHSISKDMKFDLSSTKNRSTCAAVGKVLAQRALADDIHNVVYTPRKGEILEGKLQIVLQSIIDNGIDVKVKIKQRKVKKGSLFQQKLERNVDRHDYRV